jgi:hypothetical protein
MYTVAETINIAREWVKLHGRQIPGLRAAHLGGSLTSLPPEMPFPSYRDVDILLVKDAGSTSGEQNLELPYRGLTLECGFCGLEEYRSVEKLLADPGLGPHLLADSVLYDPEGLLGPLQSELRRLWAERRWALARCEVEKRDALRALEQSEQAASIGERVVGLYDLTISLTGLLAVASLRNPTHRRCLALGRELLAHAGRLDLHEELLDLLGYATIQHSEVESWIAATAVAFDLAIAVHRSPSAFDFKLHAHVRPIFIEGSQELVDEGLHREAMWWLSTAYYIANAAIQNDGSADQRRFHQAELVRIQPLFTDSQDEWSVRTVRARRIAGEIFALADQLVANNPRITRDA